MGQLTKKVFLIQNYSADNEEWGAKESQWNSKLGRISTRAHFKHPEVLQDKRQKGRATQNSRTPSPTLQNEERPNRGKLHGHSMPIKWKRISHSIITPHIPPWKAGLLGEASSFTAMLKHRIVNTNPQKVCEQQERKIS